MKVKLTSSKGKEMKQEFCLTCDAVVTPMIGKRTSAVRFKDEDFNIQELYAYCPVCGEEFLTPETHDVNLQAVRNAYSGIST